MKTCAARRVVGSPQAPTMRFNDGAADAKSHAGPVRLGSKEGIEDLFRLLRGKPYAGIADGHQNFFFLRSLGLDGHLAYSIHFLPPIHAVHNEFHQHLFQFHTFSPPPPQLSASPPPPSYALTSP